MTPEQKVVVCGGCGATAAGPGKPYHWFSREDEDGKQIACSRRCIDVIAEKTGKTRVVLPW